MNRVLRFFLPRQIQDFLALEFVLKQFADSIGWDPLALWADLGYRFCIATGGDPALCATNFGGQSQLRELRVNDFLITFFFQEQETSTGTVRTQPEATVEKFPRRDLILERIADCLPCHQEQTCH